MDWHILVVIFKLTDTKGRNYTLLKLYIYSHGTDNILFCRLYLYYVIIVTGKWQYHHFRPLHTFACIGMKKKTNISKISCSALKRS